MKITVRPIIFKGRMDEKKLERYAKDPNVFVMYNIHNILSRYYSRMPIGNCPTFEECFKTRPLKNLYERATTMQKLNVETLCNLINSGGYILFRLVIAE